MSVIRCERPLFPSGFVNGSCPATGEARTRAVAPIALVGLPRLALT